MKPINKEINKASHGLNSAYLRVLITLLSFIAIEKGFYYNEAEESLKVRDYFCVNCPNPNPILLSPPGFRKKKKGSSEYMYQSE